MNNIIHDSASSFLRLIKIRYEFHVSEKRKIRKLLLNFSLKDFFHLAGFQHLKDIALPRNRNTTINEILENKISDDMLKKSKYYEKRRGSEISVKDRIEELQHLEEYLDTDNIIKIYSLKNQLNLQSDIDAEYVIESRISGRKTVYIFLKERKEHSGMYCVVSFFVKDKIVYGGQKLYWMLKKKYLQDKMILLYQHQNYVDKSVKEEKVNMQDTKKKQCENETKELSCVIVDMLVKERKERGFTQQMIAEGTGMKTSNVTRVESCRCIPTLDILTRYADALGKKLKVELIDK